MGITGIKFVHSIVQSTFPLNTRSATDCAIDKWCLIINISLILNN